MVVFFFYVLNLSFFFAYAINYEQNLYTDLLEDYNVLERPTESYEDTVKVIMKVTLQQLVDVDEKNQIVIVNAWIQLDWSDYNLSWEPSQYGGILNICMPADRIWKPDVLLYNSVDSKFDTKYQSNVVVYSDGSTSWVPPGIVRISCDIEIQWFPFDDQTCYFKFGSWTYTKEMLSVEVDPDPKKAFDTSELMQNGEWNLITTWNNKTDTTYGDVTYRSLYFWFKIRRRTLYYGFNMILPSLFISLITLLGFALPVECNEKVTLEITILVTLCFFLQMVLNVTPSTSLAIPLIGIFFSFHIFIVSASVAFQVLVLNFYFRNPSTHHSMSPMMRYILLHWLPWALNMHRPGYKFTRESVEEAKAEMKLPEEEEVSKMQVFASSSDIFIDSDNNNVQANVDDGAIDDRIKRCVAKILNDPNFDDPYYEATLRLVEKCHKHLKFMTGRWKRVDEEEDEKNDWKFAASVIDRVCMYLFSIFILGGTGVILFSAPHLIVE